MWMKTYCDSKFWLYQTQLRCTLQEAWCIYFYLILNYQMLKSLISANFRHLILHWMQTKCKWIYFSEPHLSILKKNRKLVKKKLWIFRIRGIVSELVTRQVSKMLAGPLELGGSEGQWLPHPDFCRYIC